MCREDTAPQVCVILCNREPEKSGSLFLLLIWLIALVFSIVQIQVRLYLLLFWAKAECCLHCKATPIKAPCFALTAFLWATLVLVARGLVRGLVLCQTNHYFVRQAHDYLTWIDIHPVFMQIWFSHKVLGHVLSLLDFHCRGS